MKFMPILAASAAALTLQVRAQDITYKIDETHADIGFSVRHMVVSTTRGAFTEFKGSFTTDAAGNLTSATCIIDTDSVDTKNAKRDEHLRGEDFFDAAKYPEITFKSTSVKKTGERKYDVVGDLTMRDVTKSITLPVEINGPIQDPWGGTRMGFEAETTVNRQDWNIKYGGLLGTGDKAIGDEVKIHISVEGLQHK